MVRIYRVPTHMVTMAVVDVSCTDCDTNSHTYAEVSATEGVTNWPSRTTPAGHYYVHGVTTDISLLVLCSTQWRTIITP